MEAECLELVGRENLKNHRLYKSGHFEIQDLASQRICLLSDISSGQRVIDGCAGAGGKTLHLAALMNDIGSIYASDIELARMRQLSMRKNRAGIKIIKQIEQKTLLLKKGIADRLILDMPCSASGTIRRKPEIKWHLTKDRLNKMIDTQRSILKAHSLLLKKGGLLTYATCSVFKCEGEEQIKWFLNEHFNYRLIEEKRFYPHIDDTDGFYMATLKRLS